MRLCRFQRHGHPENGFLLDETRILPVIDAAHALGEFQPPAASLLGLLPGGEGHHLTKKLRSRISDSIIDEHAIPAAGLTILPPVPTPGKILLLAGNYADHVREGGGQPEDAAKTFPYVFMKPSTTITAPGAPIRIPKCSPDQIDWELELAVIIGKTSFGLTPENALDAVAGYTIVNDVSDRGFRPNPERTPRPRDAFFDWLHGKWHDTFLPMGPCVLSADECPDPQALKMTLSVNDRVEQDSSTAEMIFPVREILAFISNIMTLHPGDIICTGTPAGVGKAKGRFLKPGDVVTGSIEGIGVLQNPVEAG